ncbi:MAG: DUF1289 domain-containing protein [Planctomycetes bacterium]|nr:DUF1289 domain-containing protein [Planctomycetota bacterium]
MFRWLPFRSDQPSDRGPPEGTGAATAWDSSGQSSPKGAESVASPCTSVCVLDRRGECEGCGRTVDEIALWTTLDAPARAAVVLAATQRRARRQARASRDAS